MESKWKRENRNLHTAPGTTELHSPLHAEGQEPTFPKCKQKVFPFSVLPSSLREKGLQGPTTFFGILGKQLQCFLWVPTSFSSPFLPTQKSRSFAVLFPAQSIWQLDTRMKPVESALPPSFLFMGHAAHRARISPIQTCFIIPQRRPKATGCSALPFTEGFIVNI